MNGRRAPFRLVAVLAATSIAATCPAPATEITQDQAIAIARPHVTFESASIEAVKDTDEGRRVWRITFRGKPASPAHPLLYATTVVLVDRQTGEVLSVAKTE
jgi:hypothetical protein